MKAASPRAIRDPMALRTNPHDKDACDINMVTDRLFLLDYHSSNSKSRTPRKGEDEEGTAK